MIRQPVPSQAAGEAGTETKPDTQDEAKEVPSSGTDTPAATT